MTERKAGTRGKYKDDFLSARHNGNLQFRKAKEIIEGSNDPLTVGGEVDFRLAYADFSDLEVSPQYANGQSGQKTAKAALGIEFFGGTLEGPGMPKAVKYVAYIMAAIVKIFELGLIPIFSKNKEIIAEIRHKYQSHGKKAILMETGAQKIFGTQNLKKLVIPKFVDPTIRNLKNLYELGALSVSHWVAKDSTKSNIYHWSYCNCGNSGRDYDNGGKTVAGIFGGQIKKIMG